MGKTTEEAERFIEKYPTYENAIRIYSIRVLKPGSNYLADYINSRINVYTTNDIIVEILYRG